MKYQLLLWEIMTLTAVVGYFPSAAQGEANNWYFGANAAINFETSPPTVLDNSAMGTGEGCATMSDAEGNLLFYTDGLTVFNAIHEVMLNGEELLGGGSTTQSALIVKKPGSESIYYVFAVKEQGSGGLSYSVVDMEGDGGLGVVTAEKNIVLVELTSEKVTAIPHGNGGGIWVITLALLTNEFSAFLLSNSGIDTTPVTSNVGIQPVSNLGLGYLKPSYDGEILVSAHTYLAGDNLDFLSFDNLTGNISELFALSCDPFTPYGVEFSPDQSKLYVGAFESEIFITGELIQFDLTVFEETAIQNSMTSIFNSQGDFFISAIQRGPDDLLYVANSTNFLGAILNPNAIGLACGYDPEFLDITPGFTTFGLPNFLPSFFVDASLSASQFCFGNETNFTITGAPTGVDVNWNFGDINSDTNTATGLEVSHVYSAAGTYTATASFFSGGQEVIKTIEVNIVQPTIEILGNPTVQGLAPLIVDFNFNASGQNLQIDFENDSNFDFFSSTPFESTSFTYVNPGDYLALARVTQDGCAIEDSLFIRVFTEPSQFITDFDLLGDICNPNDTFTLSIPLNTLFNQVSINYGLVGELNESFIFSEVHGTILQTVDIPAAGVYEICINYIISDVLDTTICGTYEIGLCCDFNLESIASCIETPAAFELTSTNLFTSANWEFTSPIGRVLEYNGANVIAQLDEVGTYKLSLTIEGECGDTTLVNALFLKQCERTFCEPFVPNAFTPSNDGINEVFMPIFSCEDNDFTLRVFNRWGDKIFDSGNTQNGWNGGLNGYYAQEGLYIYEVEFYASVVEKKTIRGHFILLR
ncbi:MAG: gliding motility-associated C-terminal domain-containing protein [Flavobacteriales bacterium]|jgi:gliding motility-associated-like protein